MEDLALAEKERGSCAGEGHAALRKNNSRVRVEKRKGSTAVVGNKCGQKNKKMRVGKGVL
jgi:hypothetical protein